MTDSPSQNRRISSERSFDLLSNFWKCSREMICDSRDKPARVVSTRQTRLIIKKKRKSIVSIFPATLDRNATYCHDELYIFAYSLKRLD